MFQKNTPEEGDYYAPVPPTFDASAFSGNFLTPDFNPDSILNLPGSIINSVTGVTDHCPTSYFNIDNRISR